MPDPKYADHETARRYSRARDYVEVNRAAVKEMHRQVGDLVLPRDLAGTAEVMGYLAREVSSDTYVNLMDQHHPCYRADRYPPLGRSPTPAEYAQAYAAVRRAGLYRFEQPRRW